MNFYHSITIKYSIPILLYITSSKLILGCRRQHLTIVQHTARRTNISQINSPTSIAKQAALHNLPSQCFDVP